MTDEVEPERSLGVAVVIGLTRGIVGGTALALIPCGLRLAVDPSGNALWETGLASVGIALAASSLAVADAVSARCQSLRAATAVRFVGGLLAPALGFMPQFSLVGPLHVLPLPTVEDFWLVLAFGGVSLGLGQAVAGPAVGSGDRPSGCGRAAVSATVTGIGVGIMLAVSHGDLCGALAAALAGTFLVMGALALVNAVVANRVAARVAQWLEPDARHEDLEDPAREQAREVKRARAALDEVRQGAGRGLLEEALVHARVARATGVGRLVELRHPVTRLLIETFVELGQLDEALAIVNWVTFEEPIRAEIARLGGDPAGAIARATAGLASPGWLPGYKERAATASFLAVLALAEADRGNDAAARQHLERAREIPDTVERALGRLSVPAVEAALAKRKA